MSGERVELLGDDVVCPYDQPDNMCWYCTGEACAQCDYSYVALLTCDHDVIDRHPNVDASVAAPSGGEDKPPVATPEEQR